MRVNDEPVCILHVRSWRETSLLLECLSRDYGRVGAIARGVRSGRGQARRALLEPFQDLAVDLRGRGELLVVGQVDVVGAPRRLHGDQLYSGLYLNELLVRMLARHDPHPGLLQRYRTTLDDIVAGADLAWTLRRFERDFLAALGYAMQLRQDADTGRALAADGEYVYVPELGPRRWAGQDGVRLRGSDLLALAADRRPDGAGMRRLRGLMRQLIRWHAGGELRSWQMLASLSRAR